MAANNNPIFTAAPDVQWAAALTAANTAKDGTGTVATVFAADATNGGYVHKLVARAAGTNVATVLRVFVNNELVGTVYVDERFRSAAMVVPVRGEGMHSYQLVALCKYRDADGRTVEARGVASGALDVRAGSTYRLEGEIEGTRWQALIYKKTV